MNIYETHLHTNPVSACGKASVRENLEFYSSLGYDGIFITNHFNVSWDLYEQGLDRHFSDYDESVALSKEYGIKVFLGIEISHKGSDFLIYGLDKEWFYSHSDIMLMNAREQLEFFMENGALVVHAHPFREASYIDHISTNMNF